MLALNGRGNGGGDSFQKNGTTSSPEIEEDSFSKKKSLAEKAILLPVKIKGRKGKV